MPTPAVSSRASSSNLPEPPAWNLPVAATPLIGREAELETLAQLLSDPGCRLLTLVGPGGIGKTRLAIEVACYVWERFPDGVFFAPLASVSSPEFLLPAIAHAVGLTFSGPAAPRTQLVNYLRDKRALLLLDNLEHLLEGIALLVEMLERAPRLTLLATSRERLELQSEWVFEVQGLPVPGEGRAGDSEKYSSIQLFLQGAHRAQVGFELSVEKCPDAVRICRLVEGMPLAIELAAAWVPLLSCREIADELECGLDILTTTLRDVPERQRSMRAVFEHSWQLLGQEEQQVLCALSVFQGGFTREAAEAVAGAGLVLLSALVSKSFLRRSSRERYSLHELVRQYIGARLVENSEEALAVRRRHCDYYADLLVRLELPFKSALRPAVLEELTAELDNVRAAWQWATRHQKLRELRRMSPCLYWFYDTRNLFQEGEAAYRQAVDAIRSHERPDNEPEQADAIGYVIGTLGFFSFRLGRLQEAFEYLDESWAYVSQYDDLESHFHVRSMLGFVTWAIGNAAEAHRVLSELRLLAQKIGSPWHAAIPSVLLGTVAHAQGEHEEAYRQLSEALALWRAAGDPRGLSFALASLGATSFALGKVDEAEALLRDSLALNEEIDDRWSQAYALKLVAQVLCAQRQCAEAEALLQQSLALSQEIGDSLGEAQTWVALGDTLYALNDEVKAQQAYNKAWAMALEGQMTAVLIGAALGTAEICQGQEQTERALEILLQVLSHTATSDETKARAVRLHADAISQLRPEQVKAIQAKAQDLSLEMLTPGTPTLSPDSARAAENPTSTRSG